LIIANASLTIINEEQGKFSLSGINVMDATRFDRTYRLKIHKTLK